VDDRLAIKSRAVFKNKPSDLGASAFSSTAAFVAAQAADPGAWAALGPVTPSVSGEASQFFDPATQTGPTTEESGRVTALAIDPNCGKGSAPAGAPCRLWVAAAGGGIWRTDNALAATPAWIAPPASLPTNAFGSLIVDPNDATGKTLYAGSGEPNGSGDSEAGLGLFKSTDGGQSWQLVAGSQAAALNPFDRRDRSQAGRSEHLYIGTDVARHGSSAANGGRRTPPNAAERTGARRLQVDERRGELHDREQPRVANPAEPESTGRRVGLVPGRDHEAPARSKRLLDRLRRDLRIRPLALEGRRDDLEPDVPDDEPRGCLR
jgi:hypothetical protein